jgi:hypothetical protein
LRPRRQSGRPDEARKRPRREGPAREAEEVDLVARLPREDERAVGFLEVHVEPKPEGAANLPVEPPREGGGPAPGAHARQVDHLLHGALVVAQPRCKRRMTTFVGYFASDLFQVPSQKTAMRFMSRSPQSHPRAEDSAATASREPRTRG